MNSNEEYIWFNQKYFTHKDKIFNPTGSSMEITTACNSKANLQSFSPPTLNISIFNEGLRYNINLKYQDVIDLLESIKNAQSNIDQIYKDKKSEGINKLYNSKNLKMMFRISENSGTKAVLILILNNATDYGIIIVSYNIIFKSIIELLKSFKRNYANISFEISNRALMTYMLDELRCIKGSVKAIPSSIEIENKKDKTIESLTDENSNSIQNKFQEQEGLDKYMKENVGKTKIPEFEMIENEEENKNTSIEKTESILVDKVLKNDIGNFDSLLTSINTEINPIEKIKKIFGQHFEDLDILPGITEEEFKSAAYYSKLFFLTNIQNYMKNNIQIPASIPIVKYQVLNCDPRNIDLAYDLLTISIYVRFIKEKLQTRVNDETINKSILYMSLRNFTDIFTFSFLDEIDINQITTCIVERFNSFSKSGFFNRFDEILDSYNLQKITVQDIKNFLVNTLSKVIGKGKAIYISELQEKDHIDEKIKLHPKNDLTLDLILNEVIRAEVNEKLNITDLSSKMDQKVQELFTNKSNQSSAQDSKQTVPDEKSGVENPEEWFSNIMD